MKYLSDAMTDTASEIRTNIKSGLFDDGVTAKTIAFGFSISVKSASSVLKSLVNDGVFKIDMVGKSGTVYVPSKK